jgi:hypothetical protein
MDESAESPAAAITNTASTLEDEKADSSEDDEVLDWSKVAFVQMTVLGTLLTD